jgi:hypothetical protein
MTYTPPPTRPRAGSPDADEKRLTEFEKKKSWTKQEVGQLAALRLTLTGEARERAYRLTERWGKR